MTPQNIHRTSDLAAESATRAEFDYLLKKYGNKTTETPGLSAHVRKLRGRNQSVSHWLVLAIFAGAVVALAMVQFAIR